MQKLKLNISKYLKNVDIFGTQGVDPRYRKGMKSLWLDGFFAAISGAFFETYLSLYALALGATSTQIGALSSVSSFLGMAAPIPGAQLTERLGKRKRMVVGVWSVVRTLTLGLVLIPFFLSGQAAVYAVIALFALRAGLANLAHPAWVSLSADIAPLDRRGRYFASRNVFISLITLLMVPLAGQIIEWGGFPGGYQTAFLFSALFGFIALFWYGQIPESASKPVGQGKRQVALFWQALTRNRLFLWFTLVEVIWNFAMQLGAPFFTMYQVKVLGSTPRTVGLLSMVATLTGLIGQQVWGRLLDRRSARWVIAVCGLLIPILPCLWLFFTQPWHVVFVSVPSGFLWAGFNLAAFNLLLELPAAEQRTQATASYTTLVGVANILGPMVGGYVIETLGYRWDFVLSGVGRLLGGILFLFLFKPFSRRSR